jgi:SpoU rRNA methylase family enzyme
MQLSILGQKASRPVSVLVVSGSVDAVDMLRPQAIFLMLLSTSAKRSEAQVPLH